MNEGMNHSGIQECRFLASSPMVLVHTEVWEQCALKFIWSCPSQILMWGAVLTREYASTPECSGDCKSKTPSHLQGLYSHVVFLFAMSYETFTNYNRYWDDYFSWVGPIFYGQQETA